MGFSLLALELHRAGTTVTAVAQALGVSPQFVSMQLNGRRRPHPDLIETIRALADPDTALLVRKQLEVRREART